MRRMLAHGSPMLSRAAKAEPAVPPPTTIYDGGEMLIASCFVGETMERDATYKVIAWFGRRLFVSSVVDGCGKGTEQQRRQN